MTVLCYLATIICAYLLGSLNFAIIISDKQYRQDIRDFGSKNAGMTNMMRTYGKKAAGLTLLGDALKAMISCLIGYALLGQMGAYIAGLFCIIGHMFPIYYRFKGGKGVVTAAVTILMCNPFVFLILFVMFAIIVLISKYISLGSVMCMLLYPIILDRIDRFFYGGAPYVWCAALMTLLVVVKHWENIKRLSQGKESKFSFKKSVKAPTTETTEATNEEKE
ncbi:MAG: glycerol-3-phosphate 1-O-acyltransferase PlsY [Clostridia bacterium]|nr:glycerol-3-phosphate 1-O-acyltransferase PlsY [Clostridia bacterium]